MIAAEHPLAADGGWRNDQLPRLKRHVGRSISRLSDSTRLSLPSSTFLRLYERRFSHFKGPADELRILVARKPRQNPGLDYPAFVVFHDPDEGSAFYAQDALALAPSVNQVGSGLPTQVEVSWYGELTSPCGHSPVPKTVGGSPGLSCDLD